MSAPAVYWDVRYRPKNSQEEWTVERFPANSEVTLRGVVRGVTYVGDMSAVSARERRSAWVSLGEWTVPATNREGSLALGNGTNLGSTWDYDTNVTYTATSSSVTVSFLGGTLRAEGKSVVYNASSAIVSVSPNEVFDLYMWLNDPQRMGGSVQLQVSRNFVDSVANSGYVALPRLRITVPGTGGSGSGGGNAGGGGGGGGGRYDPPGFEP